MSHVAYELSDQVATITITREEALNALDPDVLSELETAVDRVAADRARAVVVTGAGRAFVAGADVARMSTFSVAQARAFSSLGNRVFRKLELGAPSIAAVNGYALGGGCELALACDLRLASDRAVFAQPEVGLGVTAGFGGTQRLARVVGPAVAKELLLTGRRLKADRALEVGLVNAVHAPDELLGAALALAEEIAQQAPAAVRATKAAIARGAHTDLDTALGIEVEEFASCFETADQREAMAAFVQKRPHSPFQDR
ncbi:enoyl-CoA hydratase-related protein [Isoptericola sp. b441]|uniref:Enoyl-CoA hydratase-related protein n=1 Tax=Actinotalea lenta TaxID=3064654 RepID=A0ABT9D9L5_9CELL|nr:MULTISPECIES: enoyl-CoA hydratase-related protein [unclassified Isoptericola]MDO8107599.1 enoyl-CoA hydratase-related protein [Isoptericola sp. b441]MDO8120741.1 enoyl-CoA hydratase-related protein [Isoptericola sp. b490]